MVCAIISVVAIIYIGRFYLLRHSLKNTNKELIRGMTQIEENQMLFLEMPDKRLRSLLITLNQLLAQLRQKKLMYQEREEVFRKEIENISHDLRTPLTVMGGYLKMIDGSVLEKEDQLALEVVNRKVEVLQDIISQFYDLSRLGGEDYVFSMKEVDIGRMVKESVVEYYQEFTRNNLEVSVEVLDPIGLVRVDVMAMERILSNLLQNASRYAKSKVMIEVTEEEDSVVVGIGNDTEEVNPQELAHFFDRFYKKDSSRNQKGTGLGLTVAKELMERMGGKIGVEVSELDIGVLWFWLEFRKMYN